MTNCWFCGEEMIWGSDFSFDEVGLEGEGIVAFLSCPHCGCNAEFHLPLDDENE